MRNHGLHVSDGKGVAKPPMVLLHLFCTKPISNTPSSGVGCVAPAKLPLQDVNLRDSKGLPFRKTGSGPVIVYFENVNLSARQWNELQQAAQIWSRSPCIKAIAVTQCPPSLKCIHVGQYHSGEGPAGRALDRDTDGVFIGEERGGWTTGGVIAFNLDLISISSMKRPPKNPSQSAFMRWVTPLGFHTATTKPT